jgi:hypothetical protein
MQMKSIRLVLLQRMSIIDCKHAVGTKKMNHLLLVITPPLLHNENFLKVGN